jgi:transcriptional regulator with XRE-family HTH domain
MAKKILNRLKIVLAERCKTNKWLAERLGKNETTISRWCTNEMQPSLDTLHSIAEVLEVDIRQLLIASTEKENA